MIPNIFKIAGELTSTVFHIAACPIAAQGLSIFGDHSDVMATRSTGWGMLFSASVQEAMDLALVAHASTLRARVPLLHVFDGFRTSHEVMDVEPIADGHIRAMIDDALVRAHRLRGLSPDRPVMRGTAQNPDVYFQARETVNPYIAAAPAIVQQEMDHLAELTGRRYRLFEYVGAPDAERVLVLYVVDANEVARKISLGGRINTTMQACFFAISGLLPREEAIAKIKETIRETYARRGERVIAKNFAAVDAALAHLHRVRVPREVTSRLELSAVVPGFAPDFVQSVTAELIAGRGDLLPVSVLPELAEGLLAAELTDDAAGYSRRPCKPSASGGSGTSRWPGSRSGRRGLGCRSERRELASRAAPASV